jgi:hypothetical protein
MTTLQPLTEPDADLLILGIKAHNQPFNQWVTGCLSLMEQMSNILLKKHVANDHIKDA